MDDVVGALRAIVPRGVRFPSFVSQGQHVTTCATLGNQTCATLGTETSLLFPWPRTFRTITAVLSGLVRHRTGRPGMKAHRAGDGERSLAVFIDFENMGLGFNNRRDRFEIAKVLERLVEKGKIVAKKAYADWSRFGMYTGALHEAAIEIGRASCRERGGHQERR